VDQQTVATISLPHCLTHSSFLFMWEGKLCFLMLHTATDGDKQASMVILQLNKAMVTQPSASHLLGRSLQQQARTEYFADSHTDVSFTSGHYTRFLGFGVSSVERELK